MYRNTVHLVKRTIARSARVADTVDRVKVTAHSIMVLREAGLSGGPVDGIRSAKLVRKYGGFAGVLEAAAVKNTDAIAITDEAGDLPFAELRRTAWGAPTSNQVRERLAASYGSEELSATAEVARAASRHRRRKAAAGNVDPRRRSAVGQWPTPHASPA